MTHGSVIHLCSTVVHTPVVKLPEVTQLEIAALLSLRNRVRQLTEQIEAAETSLRARLEAGVSVEIGTLRAYLKPGERRSVSWKSVVERELGEGYATRVLAATRPDKFVTLVVSV